MPMISQLEILRSLYGAWRLARLDAGGMQYFVRTHEGALRSFFAALIALPPFLIIEADILAYQIAQNGLLVAVAIQAIFYVIRWTAFPVLMMTILSVFGVPEKFVDFLVAYNWGNVIQIAIFLPVLLLQWMTPGAAFLDLAYWITIGVLMGYVWFVIRTATGLSDTVVVGFVVLDLIVALMVFFVSVSILGLPTST